jgi:hypothetical protein
MQPRILITSNLAPPPPVISGVYQWLFAEEDIEAANQEQGEEIWSYDVASYGPAEEQYELFLDTCCIQDELAFRYLVEQWRVERGVASSTTEILLCPSYQSIIGMGQRAVPLILAEIEAEGDDPDQWFWALQVITRANPVAEEDEGNFNAMAQSWIAWARNHYIW